MPRGDTRRGDTCRGDTCRGVPFFGGTLREMAYFEVMACVVMAASVSRPCLAAVERFFFFLQFSTIAVLHFSIPSNDTTLLTQTVRVATAILILLSLMWSCPMCLVITITSVKENWYNHQYLVCFGLFTIDLFFLLQGDGGRVTTELLSDNKVKLTFTSLEKDDEGIYSCNIGQYSFLHRIEVLEGSVSLSSVGISVASSQAVL